MSSSDVSNIETRLSNLESALGLSSTAGSVTSSAEIEALHSRISELEGQLARANYRIKHLVQAYDELREKQQKSN